MKKIKDMNEIDRLNALLRSGLMPLAIANEQRRDAELESEPCRDLFRRLAGPAPVTSPFEV
jgi:hypothetical protein